MWQEERNSRKTTTPTRRRKVYFMFVVTSGQKVMKRHTTKLRKVGKMNEIVIEHTQRIENSKLGNCEQ